MTVANGVDASRKLIAVTGPTGVGKTTFINAVCRSNLEVGASLESCTKAVQVANCEVGGEKFTLIDTPGFDDTYKSQADILKDIADFLEQTYEKGRKVSGVIYMHRISDVRVGGIARENFRLFTKICGQKAMKNVLILTTMWEEVPIALGESREQELARNPRFFKLAIDDGARMCRLLQDTNPASQMIQLFMTYLPKVLQMQRELVDEHKQLPQTEAGTELRSELDEQVERHRMELQGLYAEMSHLVAQRENSHEEELRELKIQVEMLKGRVAMLERDKRKLAEDGKKPSRSIRTRLKQFFLSRSADSLVVEKMRNGTGCLDANGFVL
ncbi:uncharacterized protein FIBRA_03985 [Fibroporia radiculosa]|uniref:G domain-containing protein n=1 Tax=Fibroporia radiculosa TaxID=599839 RepID=J4H2Q1_9APHY|nr:uncharacterized protein FIBRA_03985 [Fibroporia radiculosa]CCM01914.1 predicted protein [Fibroporia radiculosa]